MAAHALAVPAEKVSPTGPGRGLPGARAALLLLLGINLFNFIDRQVLAAVEPEIARDLGLDHAANGKFWMGLLATAFMAAYMLTAPLFGWLADRWPRWPLVGLGVVLWSLASGGSGLNWGVGLGLAFWLLLLTRACVGVGEAAYGPVAPTVLSDLYPVQSRGRILAWFYLAIPVGSALGYAFGELVMQAWSWRWAFFLVVPPGLLLGLWCFLMRDPRRGQADAGVTRHARWHDYLDLLRIPSFVLDTLGMTAMTFALGGLAYWVPEYLEHRQALGQVVHVGPLGPRTFFGAL
ncbi:MAG TPA: MFS transporter, partial [Gemmataceae bacterium]|nr:MFS transporter [Gemmataceae bacterium]